MKTGTWTVTAEDHIRLRELTRLYEAQVEQIEDSQMELAELALEERVRNLLRLEVIPASPQRSDGRRPSSALTLYGGSGGALLLAAMILLFLRIDTSSTDPATWERSKGSQSSALVCDMHLLQGDRSTPERRDMLVYLPLHQSLFVGISCLRPVYVHLISYDPGSTTWRWIVRNQRVADGQVWLQQQGRWLDITLFLGRRLHVVASPEPIAPTIAITAGGLPQTEDPLWWEEFVVVHR